MKQKSLLSSNEQIKFLVSQHKPSKLKNIKRLARGTYKAEVKDKKAQDEINSYNRNKPCHK